MVTPSYSRNKKYSADDYDPKELAQYNKQLIVYERLCKERNARQEIIDQKASRWTRIISIFSAISFFSWLHLIQQNLFVKYDWMLWPLLIFFSFITTLLTWLILLAIVSAFHPGEDLVAEPIYPSPKPKPTPVPRQPIYREEKPERNYHGTSSWDDPYLIHEIYGRPHQSVDEMAGLYIGGGYKVEKQMHAIVVAGSGQGKGVCFVLPNLLICPHNSWFITDIKGENAMITARFQQEAGQKVAILDPWGEQMRLGATHGIAPIGFNPLTFIVSNPKEMPESAGIIAHLLVPDATGKDEYWASRARSLIKTYLLHIVTALPEEDQHLGTLYDWLRLSIKDRGAIWLDMRANTECRGLVRKGISEFFDLNPHDGPLPSIISTAQDNTVFLESEALQISLSQNGLDPYDLTDGKTTVYVCLPERFLDTHDRWLRLVTGVCLKACNYRPKERVNFLLDEFAILGKMKEIQRAFAFSRGNKINVTILVQGLGQLFEIYGQHGTNAFLSNARLRQFFGINDLDTQKYLSEYLGETTIKTFSQTKSQSKSSSETYNGDGEIEVLSSWSNGVSDTETFIARRLRTSEEIGKMPDIITFLDSYKFRLIRMPYWDNIYTAHLSGRGQYSPYNQEDWHRFLDELEGKREKRPEYRMNDQFIQRLQTGPNSIDDSQKMDI